jgi:hypothetical protein
MKQLPKYYAVKADPNNPLWFKFGEWTKQYDCSPAFDFQIWEYIGYSGTTPCGLLGADDITFFPEDTVIISLSDWAEATGHKPQDVKETEFSPGEYCLFPNEEIPAILDLLRDNGHRVWKYEKCYEPSDNAIIFCGSKDLHGVTVEDYCFGSNKKELTRDEFMYKATRGKQPTPETVQFDPEKPFKTYWNGTWHDPEFFNYIGMDSKGKYVIERLVSNTIMRFDDTKVRSIPPFTASMLKVGEYMVITDTGSYEGYIITKASNGHLFVLDTHEIITAGASWIEGRRVIIEHIVCDIKQD